MFTMLSALNNLVVQPFAVAGPRGIHKAFKRRGEGREFWPLQKFATVKQGDGGQGAALLELDLALI